MAVFIYFVLCAASGTISFLAEHYGANWVQVLFFVLPCLGMLTGAWAIWNTSGSNGTSGALGVAIIFGALTLMSLVAGVCSLVGYLV